MQDQEAEDGATASLCTRKGTLGVTLENEDFHPIFGNAPLIEECSRVILIVLKQRTP